MEFLGFQTPSMAGNTEAIVVGEVLDGKYRVETVEEDEDGQPQYKCVTLPDHKEVLVRCVGRKDRRVDAPTSLQSRSEPELVEAAGRGESLYLDRFEVQSGTESLIYVVQEQRLNAHSANFNAYQRRNGHDHHSRDSDIEDTSAVEELAQRRAPSGSRILILKHSDGSLEADIPPSVIDESRLRQDVACGVVGSAVTLAMTCGWTAVIIVLAIVTNDSMNLLGLLGSVPLCIFGVVVVRSMIRLAFVHENLLVTPTNFRIKRTIEFRPRNRDSVSNLTSAEAGVSLTDRIFCKQVSGATSDLIIATIKYLGIEVGNRSDYFVLLESLNAYRLYAVLSAEESGWLCSEVNATLQEINGSRAALEQCALDRMNDAMERVKFCLCMPFT